MQRSRGDVEVFLEMLREQQAHEHRAALAAVNQRNAVLDADTGILGTCRLAVVHGVDDTVAISLDELYFCYFSFSRLQLGNVTGTHCYSP